VGTYTGKISRVFLIAAALFLACGEEPNQDNVPRTRSGDDGRRLFFSERFVDVDVTYDRRLVARVEPYNPENPVFFFPLFVHDLQTGQKEVVTERACYPVFSPDGEWVAYQKLVGYGDLWLVKADGSTDRPLVEFAGMETPTAWSADGKKVLFHTSPMGDEIWYYDLEEGKPFFVFDGGNPFPNISLSPVWGPSGEEIFFCRETATGAVISRINADGTGLVAIWPYDRHRYEVDIKPTLPYTDRLLLTVSEKQERAGKLETRAAAWFFYLKGPLFVQLTYNPNPPRIRDWAIRLCRDNVLVFGSENLDESEKTGLYVIKTP
jgi:hypothetical protein